MPIVRSTRIDHPNRDIYDHSLPFKEVHKGWLPGTIKYEENKDRNALVESICPRYFVVHHPPELCPTGQATWAIWCRTDDKPGCDSQSAIKILWLNDRTGNPMAWNPEYVFNLLIQTDSIYFSEQDRQKLRAKNHAEYLAMLAKKQEDIKSETVDKLSDVHKTGKKTSIVVDGNKGTSPEAF